MALTERADNETKRANNETERANKMEHMLKRKAFIFDSDTDTLAGSEDVVPSANKTSPVETVTGTQVNMTTGEKPDGQNGGIPTESTDIVLFDAVKYGEKRCSVCLEVKSASSSWDMKKDYVKTHSYWAGSNMDVCYSCNVKMKGWGTKKAKLDADSQ